MLRTAILLLIIMLGGAVPLAAAQTRLGALLDAGARKISSEDFMSQVLQRSLVGSTGGGVDLNIMYTSEGRIAGVVEGGASASRGPGSTIDGEWKVDGEGRICSAIRIEGSRMSTYNLPPTCQFWYRVGDAYFVSDSDWDRSARVLRRDLKK